MDQRELLAATEAQLKRARELFDQLKRTQPGHLVASQGPKAEVSEFLRNYAGPKSSFYVNASALHGGSHFVLMELVSILEAFRDYVASGLHEEVSPERRAQLDVVTDLLEQAQRLLDDREVHPAAAAMLIGATLEEFLRTWVEELELSIGDAKPSLQTYSDVLRRAEEITKQDAKDILSWAGLRNYAAHGEWEQVKDKERVGHMLDGVNLFMRKYGA